MNTYSLMATQASRWMGVPRRSVVSSSWRCRLILRWGYWWASSGASLGRVSRGRSRAWLVNSDGLRSCPRWRRAAGEPRAAWACRPGAHRGSSALRGGGARARGKCCSRVHMRVAWAECVGGAHAQRAARGAAMQGGPNAFPRRGVLCGSTAQAISDGLRRDYPDAQGARVFSLTRSSFAGQQRSRGGSCARRAARGSLRQVGAPAGGARWEANAQRAARLGEAASGPPAVKMPRVHRRWAALGAMREWRGAMRRATRAGGRARGGGRAAGGGGCRDRQAARGGCRAGAPVGGVRPVASAPRTVLGISAGYRFHSGWIWGVDYVLGIWRGLLRSSKELHHIMLIGFARSSS